MLLRDGLVWLGSIRTRRISGVNRSTLNDADMNKLRTLFVVLTLAVSTAPAQCIIHGVAVDKGYCNNYPRHYTHNVVIYGEAENKGSRGRAFFTPNFASGTLPYIHHPICNQSSVNYILALEEEDCKDALLITIRDMEFPESSRQFSARGPAGDHRAFRSGRAVIFAMGYSIENAIQSCCFKNPVTREWINIQNEDSL
jgi:hypothetical protein